LTGPAASGDVLGTPAPVLRADRVITVMREVWGLRADSVRPLAAERDANIWVDGRYVLKVSNPAEDPAVVDMENTAMAHAAEVGRSAPSPPGPAWPCRACSTRPAAAS
jgi:hydroxylysine kinase